MEREKEMEREIQLVKKEREFHSCWSSVIAILCIHLEGKG